MLRFAPQNCEFVSHTNSRAVELPHNCLIPATRQAWLPCFRYTVRYNVLSEYSFRKPSRGRVPRICPAAGLSRVVRVAGLLFSEFSGLHYCLFVKVLFCCRVPCGHTALVYYHNRRIPSILFWNLFEDFYFPHSRGRFLFYHPAIAFVNGFSYFSGKNIFVLFQAKTPA